MKCCFDKRWALELALLQRLMRVATMAMLEAALLLAMMLEVAFHSLELYDIN